MIINMEMFWRRVVATPFEYRPDEHEDSDVSDCDCESNVCDCEISKVALELREFMDAHKDANCCNLNDDQWEKFTKLYDLYKKSTIECDKHKYGSFEIELNSYYWRIMTVD